MALNYWAVWLKKRNMLTPMLMPEQLFVGGPQNVRRGQLAGGCG